jgi:ribonuclease HII
MNYVIGIDEVGRGPLAGPVAVCALALPKKFKVRSLKLGGGRGLGLKDSKKLSVKQREEWFEYVKNQPKIFYEVARVYPKTIDRINISRAANLAAGKALNKLIRSHRIDFKKSRVLLDGGLFVPEKFNGRTIVKGDEKIDAIKLASIVAKVTRDKLLKNYSRKYRNHGFDSHKGYGTKAHIKALKNHGITKIHRLTFLKNYHKIISNR